MMLRSHVHSWINRWRWRRPVRSSSGTRIVLAPSPRKSDSGVTNGITLHLVDGHFRCVTLYELDETAALAWRDFDVGNFAESLEERSKLILRDIARETADEDSGVVGIRKLVHRLLRTIIVG